MRGSDACGVNIWIGLVMGRWVGCVIWVQGMVLEGVGEQIGGSRPMGRGDSSHADDCRPRAIALINVRSRSESTHSASVPVHAV